MTLRETVEAGAMILERAGVPDAKIDAWYLLEMVCHIDKNYYYMHGEDDITEEQQRDYESVLKKRAERVPLQYITGEQEFMGLTFKVNSNVLIPRQDTEILVEQALRVCQPGMRVLDMCTGSGCIIISMMKYQPDLIGEGADVSKQALIQAKENARGNETSVEWICSDLFERISEQYDVIVSNPPYIPTKIIETLMPEVRDFEPVEALDGKEDGLYFYREIVGKGIGYLKPNGYLFLEIGYDQAEAVTALMEDAGYSNIKVIRDLAGLDRVVMGQFVAL